MHQDIDQVHQRPSAKADQQFLGDLLGGSLVVEVTRYKILQYRLGRQTLLELDSHFPYLGNCFGTVTPYLLQGLQKWFDMCPVAGLIEKSFAVLMELGTGNPETVKRNGLTAKPVYQPVEQDKGEVEIIAAPQRSREFHQDSDAALPHNRVYITNTGCDNLDEGLGFWFQAIVIERNDMAGEFIAKLELSQELCPAIIEILEEAGKPQFPPPLLGFVQYLPGVIEQLLFS
jgi:hypothetical protein